MQNKKLYKLAIIAPTPLYYHVPLYRRLESSSEIDLTVYYCSDEAIHGTDIERMYETKKNTVDKINLLRGYHYMFLKNYSLNPSCLNWPFGLMNFGIWNDIKSGKYDGVVLQSWTNLTWWIAFFACLRYKTPVLFMTDANVAAESSKSKFKIFLKKIILGNFLFENASGFLTSGTTNEELYKYYGVPPEKMVRVYFSWGYEYFLEKAKQLNPKRDGIRKSLGIEKNDFVILYVGRLSKEKMPMLLLEAYRKIKNGNKKLFIVGDGPMRKEFEQCINNLSIKNVILTGFQPREKLGDFYVAADVLVLPSEFETWGIVINEAMCFSLPVITSERVGASVDLIKNGYNGFIFSVGNADQFSEAIEKIMNLPKEGRQLFGQRSFDIINKWLSEADPIMRILNLLNTIKNEK
ncbi:MAG: glycosyltransferase family 4 protein [Candidatus Staskawiczbacteria bacterium]|nr:glycosyltransferase family 4 protein [Candidatus Staskawiczbacteria bacterium]